MTGNRIVLAVLVLLFTGPLAAGPTLFGTGPRTLWEGGKDIQFDTVVSYQHRMFEHDHPISNPRDMRVFKVQWEPGIAYGVTRDFSVKGVFPVAYAEKSSKDMETAFFGLGDFKVAGKYSLYNEPFPGGSAQAGTFVMLRLPTAKKRKDLSLGNETFGVMAGVSAAWGDLDHTFIFDAVVSASSQRSGSGMGPGVKLHGSYSYRPIEMTDYQDLDFNIMAELDLDARSYGRMNGKVNPNSGHYIVSAAAGVMVGISGKLDIKLGYELPLYRQVFGRQMVNEGTGVLAISLLLK